MSTKRPQTPLPPYPYSEVLVEYQNPVSHLKLAGTLTLPKGAGPFPAALLITGSGQHDRDETIFGHKPFLVIADWLTRHGVAVLRVDDRGVGGSEKGDLSRVTSADFATDVEAGLSFLRKRPKVASVGLIGHSEGAMIAQMVAAEDPSVAWMVMLAGPGVPGTQMMVEQARLIGKASGMTQEQLDQAEKVNRNVYRAVVQESIQAEREKKVVALLVEAGMTKAQAEQQVKLAASDWFRFILAYDPAPYLARIQCPLLALFGEKDLQVNPISSQAAIQASQDKRDWTVKTLPSLNHLFQTARTGLPSEYETIEETFSPVALQVLSDWILNKTSKPARLQ